MFDHCISKEGSLLDVAVEAGVVERRGSYYSFGDVRMAQGRENAKEYLRDQPEIAAEIEKQVREQIGLLSRKMSENETVADPSEQVEE